MPGAKVTDAVVSTDSGGVPFSARACESAMLKHDACAAAMSSSGVVTEVEPSLRAFQFTSNVPSPEERKRDGSRSVGRVRPSSRWSLRW